jgi:hypothetical protein
MSEPSHDPSAAFRGLQRALLRRRLAAIEPRLRVELVAIGTLIAGFVFWQERVRLASLAFDHGPIAVARESALTLALLALTGGALAFARHVFRLRGVTPGPAWLALPLPPHLVHRHLAWGSRTHALWVVPLALGVLAAGLGLVPGWWPPLLAAGFLWLLLESGRAGCAIAWRLAARAAEPRPGLHPITRVLASSARAARIARAAAPRWRNDPPWRAIMRNDLLVTRRPGPARARAIAPLALGACAFGAWALPVAPALAHFAAFALTLGCAAAAAEWIIALAGGDPFPVLKTLPLRVGDVWGARAAWAVLIALTLTAGHAVAARTLDGPARLVFLIWSGGAALAIGLLGTNYAVTLYPRAHHAQRLLALSLGLAVAASLMVPLMGWIVLATAVIHSARRLPRWARIESA